MGFLLDTNVINETVKPWPDERVLSWGRWPAPVARSPAHGMRGRWNSSMPIHEPAISRTATGDSVFKCARLFRQPFNRRT